MREHINNVGGLISYTIYSSSAGKKKKLKFQDFILDYKDLTKTDEERLADNFKQYEKENQNNFKVV